MILVGDVMDRLRGLPDESVHCVVTSPPYWGLRDYGISDQIGLEPTPAAYVEKMVGVFREVRRVLREDGTCWVNLGDSFAGGKVGGNDGVPKEWKRPSRANKANMMKLAPGLKPKDMCMIPARVALALQADGWWLRMDMIWAKPNPMPESVTDRPTKAHEYIFLLTKAARYFYDAEAVREAYEPSSLQRFGYEFKAYGADHPQGRKHGAIRDGGTINANPAGRNARSVQTWATQPFPEAHFATYPEALPRFCIRAGSPTKCCSACGAGWVREVENIKNSPSTYEERGKTRPAGYGGTNSNKWEYNGGIQLSPPTIKTLGFRPSCSCVDYEYVEGIAVDRHECETTPATVLDPFAGSGTTGKVAIEENRAFIGIELNPDYAKMAERRMSGVQRSLIA